MIRFAVILLILLASRWVYLEFSRRSRRTLDLETDLDRIRRDLRSQTQAAEHEREQLSTVMGAISDAILAVDRNGKTLFLNSKFSAQFAQPGMDPSRASLAEFFRTPEVLAAFSEAIADEEGKTIETLLDVRSDASSQHFALSVAPLRGAHAEIYGAVGVFHNVSELKKAEKIRIDFVANVSHELRTPLTAIKGYTDTVLQDVRTGRFDAAPGFLEIISRNVDRLKLLVEDLLDLSALDAGVEVSKSWVNTQEVTDRILQHLEPKRLEKGHVIDCVYTAKDVFADSKRLEQVLINLVDNSIKYLSQHGKIQISWVPMGDAVELRVVDNGPGISKDLHSRIFERFYRVDKGRSRDMGGTGLGLAIVKHIMQRHGGSITVDGDEGEGTEFTCSFPNPLE